MTSLTEKQKSLLDELLQDFDGDAESLLGKNGLKGLPECIEAVYPHTRVQLCIAHQARNGLKYVSWKDRKKNASKKWPVPFRDGKAALNQFIIHYCARLPV